MEACTFEPFEVYAIDIVMTTGEGKARDVGKRTTVFKRQVDRKYGLKVKASRIFFNEVNKRFPSLPFSLRSLPDEKGAKMGYRECVNHELLVPYPCLYERAGDKIAHVKFTVLLLAGGTQIVTGLLPPPGMATPDKSLPEDLLAMIAEGQGEKDKKNKKKVAKRAAGGGGGKEDEETEEAK